MVAGYGYMTDYYTPEEPASATGYYIVYYQSIGYDGNISLLESEF
jgi:hypothetical protein